MAVPAQNTRAGRDLLLNRTVVEGDSRVSQPKEFGWLTATGDRSYAVGSSASWAVLTSEGRLCGTKQQPEEE